MYWYELSKPDGSDDWSKKVGVNSQTNLQNAKGGPDANFDKTTAWTKVVNYKIIIDIKGLSAIYLLVEGK